MLSQKLTIVVALFLVPLGLLAYFALSSSGWDLWTGRATSSGTKALITVKDVPVRVDLATTPKLQQRGLSGREQLEPDEGMLFVWEEAAPRGIWMKDMRFPIDILWLDGAGRVLDIKRNAVPESYPEVFYPRTPATFVLELSANFTELHSVSIGDVVKLPQAVLPPAQR